MTSVEKLDLTPPAKAPKAPKNGSAEAGEKPKKEKKEGGPRRSSFSKIYPDNAAITVLAKENPKKQGSKARERFEAYSKSKTVAEFLKNGGTYADLAYDVGHAHVAVAPVV